MFNYKSLREGIIWISIDNKVDKNLMMKLYLISK